MHVWPLINDRSDVDGVVELTVLTEVLGSIVFVNDSVFYSNGFLIDFRT